MKNKANKKTLVCTVKRSKWDRGGKGGEAKLFNSEGMKCCLGFLGTVCQVPDEALLNADMPYDLPREFAEKYPALKDTDNWHDFACYNDSVNYTDEEREGYLRDLAKQHVFRFRFVK